MNQLEKVVRQIDDALACYDRMSSKVGGKLQDLDGTDLFELHTSVAAAVESLAPPNSVYHHNAEIARGAVTIWGRSGLLAGVLRALRTAYLGGYLDTISDLVRADLFDDFLEMASHLLERGYKDPAAVIAGSVLEEHLRKLCQRHKIQTVAEDKPKPASRMNDELAAAGAYGKLDGKSVTAWLDLRNRAAHAKYDEYTAEQVRLMVHGVRDFAARTLSGVAG